MMFHVEHSDGRLVEPIADDVGQMRRDAKRNVCDFGDVHCNLLCFSYGIMRKMSSRHAICIRIANKMT